MPRNISPVTTSIVHKSDADDVFVARPRLILPERIPSVHLSKSGASTLLNAGLYSITTSEDLVASVDDDQTVPGYYEVKPVKPDAITPSTLLRSDEVKMPLTIVYDVKNTASHYYFYRKEHEHVPGLMLIEVARQAMYHYVYNAYDTKRGQVSISMSSLLARFDDYTESSLPLSVIVTQNVNEYTSSPRHIDLQAKFLQNGKWVGSVNLTGGVMKIALFERLRRFDLGDNQWFSPFPHWDMPILLETREGTVEAVQLQAICGKGAVVQIKQRGPSTIQSVYRLIITTKTIGCIALPVSDTRFDTEGVHVNFGNSRTASLNEFIKRYCTLIQPQPTPIGIHQ